MPENTDVLLPWPIEVAFPAEGKPDLCIAIPIADTGATLLVPQSSRIGIRMADGTVQFTKPRK